MIGKLLFVQTSELINPDLSNGLSPNLSADDPSLSFTMKGVDVNMAAYMSGLAFLTAPVSSHVQSAEMHNPSVNSHAFITSRYTMEVVELVSLMSVTSSALRLLPSPRSQSHASQLSRGSSTILSLHHRGCFRSPQGGRQARNTSGETLETSLKSMV
jgi:Aromatic amino acid lyase